MMELRHIYDRYAPTCRRRCRAAAPEPPLGSCLSYAPAACPDESEDGFRRGVSKNIRQLFEDGLRRIRALGSICLMVHAGAFLSPQLPQHWGRRAEVFGSVGWLRHHRRAEGSSP